MEPVINGFSFEVPHRTLCTAQHDRPRRNFALVLRGVDIIASDQTSICARDPPRESIPNHEAWW